MKKILTILFLLCICQLSMAQEFEVITAEDHTVSGGVGETIVAPIMIKNITDRPIYVFIDRVEKTIGSSQTTKFCWGNECFDSQVERLPLSKKIEPGETSDAFVSILESGLVEGFSSVKYHIYTRSNRDVYVEHEVTYAIEGESNSKALYTSDEMIFNEIYPNPVREFTVINYKINDPMVEAKVMLHNVLGSVMGTYELPVLEQSLKVDTKSFNPGVYFYTLFVDGDGIITKKMIIRLDLQQKTGQ